MSVADTLLQQARTGKCPDHRMCFVLRVVWVIAFFALFLELWHKAKAIRPLTAEEKRHGLCLQDPIDGSWALVDDPAFKLVFRDGQYSVSQNGKLRQSGSYFQFGSDLYAWPVDASPRKTPWQWPIQFKASHDRLTLTGHALNLRWVFRFLPSPSENELRYESYHFVRLNDE